MWLDLDLAGQVRQLMILLDLKNIDQKQKCLQNMSIQIGQIVKQLNFQRFNVLKITKQLHLDLETIKLLENLEYTEIYEYLYNLFESNIDYAISIHYFGYINYIKYILIIRYYII